ncbi:hypothetical protein BX600DRAFT_449259 [Xylariales sp. PMI_506]|nr:hypothetical protein BX600DRAFT_449259 [Xylariales sp. PMI_506]
MDFSPPSLSLSPVSSPNTDYPSPGFVDTHYKLTSTCDRSCGIEPGMDSDSMPSMDASTPEDWNDSILLHPSTSADISSIIHSGCESYSTYGPPLTSAYGHDIFPTLSTHSSSMALGTQQFPRSLSHTSDPSGRHHVDLRQSGSPPPRIKLEPAGEYSGFIEPPRYPSPYSGDALPGEIGHYSPAGSSVTSWTKTEFSTIDLDHYGAHPSAGYHGEKPEPNAAHKPPRNRSLRKFTTKEDANHQCEQCGKLFSRSYNYKAHLETHHENREYPFPCAVGDCTRKFVRKTDLQRHHQSVHMKEKNHKCDFCSRMFARKDTLRRYSGTISLAD